MAQITLRDYLQKTEDAISSSRVDDALAHCQHMLSYFPEALEIQRLLGEVYLEQGRLEDAQHLFDWVLMNDPENILAYCNRADISERMSEYDFALDCYQQAYELNRGYGQIREEFNRLSEKVGQKGFMYSRAGLARLYMRGNLLSQALQEWDAVLATTPDRLDARTGQLETYWRAGLLEKVEQLAEQILRNVPGCLKALLLQARVISSKDAQRAQELLRRAEALDPEHVVAQELFADALASHPDDPFLQQLKNTTVLLPEAKETATSLGQAHGLQQAQELQQNSFTSVSDPVNSLPSSNSVPLQAPWNAPTQEMSSAQFSQETYTGNEEQSLEPWELLQNALNQFDTNGAEPGMVAAEPVVPYDKDVPLWEDMASPVELSPPSLDVSPSPSLYMPEQQEQSISLSGFGTSRWSGPTQEPIPSDDDSIPDPPSWLNMLAQTDIAVGKSNTSALTTEYQSDHELPLADASLEQLIQSNTTSSEAQTVEAFVSPPPSQPLPFTTSAEKAESQPSWLESMDVEQGEEEEESFFGPSWLKSLGATTMAEEEAPAAAAPAAEAKTQHVTEPEHTASQREEHYQPPFAQHSEALMQVSSAEYAETQSVYSNDSVPETNPYELWEQQASLNNSPNIHEQTSWASAEFAEQPQNAQNTRYEAESFPEHVSTSDTPLPISLMNWPAEQPIQWEAVQEEQAQNLMTTLEELEQSLRSKGFIPLEPNSLSTLATQAQEGSFSSHDLDALQAPEAYDVSEFQQSAFKQELQEPQEALGDSSLSSALARLGGFVKESPPPTEPSLASSLETLEQDEEPSWMQALRKSSATPAVPATPTLPDTSIVPSAPAGFADDLPQTSPVVPQEPITATSRNLAQPASKELQQTAKTPPMPANPLLDGELETTMKRPAIRLQPMQKHSSPSQRPGGYSPISRSQSGERIEKGTRVTKSTNENLSYRDRLVKGYQYQLVGDYDEAMQEYRIIIRSSADLLSEVVSNVRALLKLAPNYTAGYRVLGDAYMRQGEYLQAMEAYNKALNMAKKVKSQA